MSLEYTQEQLEYPFFLMNVTKDLPGTTTMGSREVILLMETEIWEN